MVVKTTINGQMMSGWSVQLSIHHFNTARLYNIGNVKGGDLSVDKSLENQSPKNKPVLRHLLSTLEGLCDR